MKREFINAHFAELAKRYGIKNVEGFRRSARRYECCLNRLFTLYACDARRSEWAEAEAEKVSEAAGRNLSKYCRNHKLFMRDLYINRDPRGYSLKLSINHASVSRNFLCRVDRDWGDNFVIAPNVDK